MRNDYSAVNSVMGRSSDWRDPTTHNGKPAVRLSWELNPSTDAAALLERVAPRLLNVPGVQKVWLSYGNGFSEANTACLQKLCVKYTPAA